VTTQIKLLNIDAFYEWDRFVHNSEGSLFFHQTRWLDHIRINFKHRPFYLYTKRDGEITGILPLHQVKSAIIGLVMVSAPYAVYGGIVANEEEDWMRLLDASKDLARRMNIKYIEYRNLEENNADLPSNDLYHTFIGDIPENEDDCLKKIPRKSRASARQGRDKFGLKFIQDNSLINEFYDLFVLNKRSLGSPVFSRNYFKYLMDIFDGNIFINCVTYEEKVVSAVMSFVYKDMILPYYSGSDKRYERYNTNNFQYWKLMEWACKRGYKYFDFGRSRKGTGAFKFKMNMGFTPKQLNYQFYFPKEGSIPNLNPSNPKLDLPKKIISKIPVSIAKVIGPLLIRHIP